MAQEHCQRVSSTLNSSCRWDPMLIVLMLGPALLTDPSLLLSCSCCCHMQLPLLSAYATMFDANGAVDSRLQKQKQRLDQRHHEPMFTNITKDFKGTLDYILYTTSSLQVCGSLCAC